MAYDDTLAVRLRELLADVPDMSEKRMMGGLCFLTRGNMLCGLDRTKDGQDRFMFRVGKENEAEALKRPGAEIVAMGGKRIGGFIFVAASACKGTALKSWLALAECYVQALPAKAKKAPRRFLSRKSPSR